jgi:hypothetical protein
MENVRHVSSKVVEVLQREISGDINKKLFRLGKPIEAISTADLVTPRSNSSFRQSFEHMITKSP